MGHASTVRRRMGASERDDVAAHQAVLDRCPRRIGSYRALYQRYLAAGAYDEAWCVAAALVVLDRADPTQRRFYERHRLEGPIRPTAPLDDERWLRDLVHPDQDLILSRIFGQLALALLSEGCQTDREAGLRRKYEHDTSSSTVSFVRTFGFAANVLGVVTPRLFLRTDIPGGLTAMPVWPLASLSGATLLSGFTPHELLFVAGHHLSDYREDHYLRTLFRSSIELRSILRAGLRIAEVKGTMLDSESERSAQQLALRLGPGRRESLVRLGELFVEAGRKTDVGRWLRSTELTACQAGFLVCNDLPTATRMTRRLGARLPVDLSPSAKEGELVRFSVSERYFRLRRHLGIAIGPGTI